jgi:hypothetical protein
MNTKVILTGTLALAAAVAPVVIGRYGDEFAGFLRVDVLAGIGVVATLVALITLEYSRGNTKAARRQPVVLRSLEGEATVRHAAPIVSLAKGGTRAAA